ncbi:PIG-L deacetylase family protein [Candidatus Sordicultor fermentans]|jgi:LmbE family N-acetylglucosaminyl deacetylase|uniref:PIG-L deacetylase family protein n=1 Tax=Candidatus Sordicultor fermentans TaxID=1953203 RepID=UPI002A337D4B|nr:PIG-L family deacetylase [Atribacterota bacterium]HOA99141.1 PIG-L family deacetylase [Candidatus Atribacteria bacterium]MDI9606649.1 PIG-L family deacetylase [Atribacterota bacterium]HOQ50705.1 PIG-L family deacetylase [Candidatus Atribacteria bacterium]HPZ39995.1 PIG-L family deacetylase [Candidatus Atribacteria bacterium]
MMEREDFTFYDLRRREKSKSIELLFPGWVEGEERVAIFCPHDDDGILGPGYLLQAIPLFGGEVHVVIFCNGSGGYSVIEHKNIITALRARETVLAYAHLGVKEERIHRLDYDDYSVWPFLGWKLPGGEEGTFRKILPLLRRLKITRVLVPNGYREHLDHYATFLVGAFDTPQVGDPVMADWGIAKGIKSVLQYAVWSDFSPEDTLLEKDALNVRANRALCAPREAEEKINLAMSEFKTQAQIIAGLLEQRKERNMEKGMIEVYLSFDPRPRCEYDKYVRRIQEIESKEEK